MKVTASIKNSFQNHTVQVSTEGDKKEIVIPAKAEGFGSSVNGGELLFLSLATCFCNDLYREAARRNMKVDYVGVNVSGEFGKEGEPGSNIVYNVDIQAPNHSQEEITKLVTYVDQIAEVHNTLRKGTSVSIKSYTSV